jgi:hypothetical protein
MDDTPISIVVFAIIGFVVPLVLRIVIRNPWAHIPASALLTSGLFQLIIFLRLGHWEMFALVAFITGIFAGALLAGVVYVLTIRDGASTKPTNGRTS